MPTINGTISNSGQPVEGSNFSSKNIGTGEYEVQFAPGVFNETPIVVATPVTQEGYTCAI